MIKLEEPPICECKYDEVRDEMDCEDCAFHCDLVDDVPQHEAHLIQRKKADSKPSGGRRVNRFSKQPAASQRPA
jgi:hypothetical protein